MNKLDSFAGDNWVHPRKAQFDQYDDGSQLSTLGHKHAHLWEEFKAWAKEHLGQGYSLATSEGSIIDPVTSWSFKAYCAGKTSTKN